MLRPRSSSIRKNLEIQEQLISFVVQNILNNYEKELAILERDLGPLKKVTVPFHRITHKEAVEKLNGLGSKIGPEEDLGAEDEALLMEQYDKPLFVEKYPAKIKAFYMKRDPRDETRALCADLLAPEGYGEIIGGSQREDDYVTLLSRIKEHELPVEAFEWYLDLRRYGSVPHSGFGVGLERLVAWISGIKHVRETIPFPRMITRKTP
jgi:asparaginyl-tRNA synthetase